MPSGSWNHRLWNAPRSSTVPSLAPRSTSRRRSRERLRAMMHRAPGGRGGPLEHRREGAAVGVADRPRPGGATSRPGSQDGVAERRRRLAEHHIEVEHVDVELDEAVEVGGQDGDVVDAGEHGHVVILPWTRGRPSAVRRRCRRSARREQRARSPAPRLGRLGAVDVPVVAQGLPGGGAARAAGRRRPPAGRSSGRVRGPRDGRPRRGRRRARRCRPGGQQALGREQQLAHDRRDLVEARKDPADQLGRLGAVGRPVAVEADPPVGPLEDRGQQRLAGSGSAGRRCARGPRPPRRPWRRSGPRRRPAARPPRRAPGADCLPGVLQ